MVDVTVLEQDRRLVRRSSTRAQYLGSRFLVQVQRRVQPSFDPGGNVVSTGSKPTSENDDGIWFRLTIGQG